MTALLANMTAAAAAGNDRRAGVLRAVPDPWDGAGESTGPWVETAAEDAGPGHPPAVGDEAGDVAIATAPVPALGCE